MKKQNNNSYSIRWIDLIGTIYQSSEFALKKKHNTITQKIYFCGWIKKTIDRELKVSINLSKALVKNNLMRGGTKKKLELLC